MINFDPLEFTLHKCHPRYHVHLNYAGYVYEKEFQNNHWLRYYPSDDEINIIDITAISEEHWLDGYGNADGLAYEYRLEQNIKTIIGNDTNHWKLEKTFVHSLGEHPLLINKVMVKEEELPELIDGKFYVFSCKHYLKDTKGTGYATGLKIVFNFEGE